MPGDPAKFTDQTIIYVGANASTGKSTLCNYIASYSKDHIVHLPCDRYFTESAIRSTRLSKTDRRSLTHLLEEFDEPHHHVSRISRLIENDSKLTGIFADMIVSEIKRYFESSNVKIIMIEGFSLTLTNISRQIKSRLSKYRQWNLHV